MLADERVIRGLDQAGMKAAACQHSKKRYAQPLRPLKRARQHSRPSPGLAAVIGLIRVPASTSVTVIRDAACKKWQETNPPLADVGQTPEQNQHRPLFLGEGRPFSLFREMLWGARIAMVPCGSALGWFMSHVQTSSLSPAVVCCSSGLTFQ